MSVLIKKLLLASALVLGLSVGLPAFAGEEPEGTEEVQPAPTEEAAPEEAPAEEGQMDEGSEAPAPQEGTEAAE